MAKYIRRARNTQLILRRRLLTRTENQVYVLMVTTKKLFCRNVKGKFTPSGISVVEAANASWNERLCKFASLPSALTLARQSWRHVDAIVFENLRSSKGSSGSGGSAATSGRLALWSVRAVPGGSSGHKAVVCAIYEPPAGKFKDLKLLPDPKRSWSRRYCGSA